MVLKLQLKGYIDPKKHASGCVRAVDIDDGRLAVGYEDAIVIWDIETMTEVTSFPWDIDPHVELHFNNKRQKILVTELRFGLEC